MYRLNEIFIKNYLKQIYFIQYKKVCFYSILHILIINKCARDFIRYKQQKDNFLPNSLLDEIMNKIQSTRIKFSYSLINQKKIVKTFGILRSDQRELMKSRRMDGSQNEETLMTTTAMQLHEWLLTNDVVLRCTMIRQEVCVYLS